MKRLLIFAAIGLLFPAATWASAALSSNDKTSAVFIANYANDGTFLGWGSGFFVDEAIIVTNKHVIEAGDWYRIYATGTDDKVDLTCKKDITKSDVKINLDDDVAYMRAYLPCTHGKMLFADDPKVGDPVYVIGYPYKGSLQASLNLTVTTGSVMPGAQGETWLRTDAHLDVGNSGGPVTNGTDVLGVAVAKGVDDQGNFITGYFIPSSVILNGLLYANDSRFGYTPQSSSSRSSISSSSFVSSRSSVSSSSSSRRSSASSSASTISLSSRSSKASSVAPVFPDVSARRASYDAIMSLFEEGVISGYPDGTFRPTGSINRAEFIKILMLGFHDQEILGETGCFADVADEWFAPYVCAAKRLGWIDGYADGNFRPAQLVNRAEAMKIVTEAFGAPTPRLTSMPPDVPGGSWFHPFVARGILIGIVAQNEPFRPGDNLTREEAAMWIDGAKGF